MRLPIRLATLAAIPVIGMASALVGATAANAEDVTPYGVYCDPNVSLDVNNQASNYMIPLSSQIYKDGPGGTISVSVTQSGTVSSTATVTASVKVSDIVTEAKVDVSASVTSSTSITVGHTYSHNITAGKYGNAEYGSWGYNVVWKQWQNYSNCTSSLIAQGTGKLTSNAVGWKYWETSV